MRLGGTQSNPPSNPHNQYLLWAVEGGFIGLVLMIGILIALYRDARQLETPVQWAMLSTLALVAVTGLFNCPFFGAGMGEFYLLIFGVFLAMGRKDPFEIDIKDSYALSSPTDTLPIIY